MKKKLTLTIEESVKEKAKKFAQSHNTSVSDIVENYLSAVTGQHDFRPKSGSVTKSLMGSVKLPKEYEGMNYKEIKKAELKRKYGG